MYNIGVLLAPTIFRIWNMKVIVFPKDHFPPHVHVWSPEAEAKFDMRSWECIESYGFTANSLKRIRQYLKEREATLWEAWNEYQK